LRAEGLNRRPTPASDRPKRGQGRFKDYDLGFVHIDIKHPPKLRTAHGRRRPAWDRPRRGQGRFKDYDLGFVHIDIKHLPKLRTADGERRKRYLYVAIDRCSRSVHLAVQDDETEDNAIAFLKQAIAAFPFKVTHVLT